MLVRFPAPWLGLVLAAACTETVKQTYDIDITGAPDAFAGAVKVSLYASDAEVATTMVNGNAPFSLAWRDVDPGQRANAIFSIRAFDAAGAVIASGTTPDIELRPASTSIRIFVQRPGTLVKAGDLPSPVDSHVAVSADSLFTADLNRAMTAPVFGAGKERKQDGTEAFSAELYVYNPITHRPQRLTPMRGAPRIDAAAIARSDGVVMVFGGRARTPGADTSAQLDFFQIGRRDVNVFQVAVNDIIVGPPETARSHTVLVQVGRPVFAFGGLDLADMPLDTVVNIDPVGRAMTPLDLAMHGAMGAPRQVSRMSAPRVGHTASAVTTPEVPAMGPTVPAVPARTHVLVFGGARGGPVADLFDPADQSFQPLDLTTAGPGRRDHAAVTVPGPMQSRLLLLLGGLGDDGAPRGDSVLFDPVTRKFAPGGITLRTPRSAFTAFVMANDLVILGGIGPDGKRLGTGEVYDARDLSFVGMLTGEARSRATATPLPNLTMVILGGTTDTSASSAIEIYQPRRTTP